MGTITSESSILHSPVAMTERECRTSRTVMPAPEIRLLQFDFLSFSLPLPSSSPSLSFLTGLGDTKIIGDMHQSIPYLPHQNWDRNSNLATLYLFPSAAITLSHNRNDCYLTIPFSVASLISFSCL